MDAKIISVHFPKAGGTSLKKSLINAFGPEHVYLDYKDDPKDPICQYNLDPERACQRAAILAAQPEIQVIHGHFHPGKYGLVKGARWITFLRHPLDNLFSIYFYWKTIPGLAHALYNYFKFQNLTLLDMSRLPVIRYLMSRTYFGGVDMDSFEFIGFQENYLADLRSLALRLSIPFDENHENLNVYSNYSAEVQAIRSDQRMLEQLSENLAADIDFYERVKKSRA